MSRVKLEHKNIDAEFKQLAREYRHSASLIEARIEKLKGIIKTMTKKKAPAHELHQFDEELKVLRSMSRTARETGSNVFHYYESGWWRG